MSALEQDEIRHNVLLTILDRLAADNSPEPRRWTLGQPGQCAVQTPGYPIMLGEVTEAQCRALAEELRDDGYPGVVGPDDTAAWLAECARQLGAVFAEPIPQQIHALREAPAYPGAPGQARSVTAADKTIFADWMMAFLREAVPSDPVPSRERLESAAGNGRYLFWVVDDEPVSMAGIVRRTRNCAAIAGVYTPRALRGRGYAGSVTAALVERIYAEGRAAACLYTDLRNPYSNRCYAKIGFRPVCNSWHYVRA